MRRQSPWIMVAGGIALLNVAMLVGGIHAPDWARYAAMAACGAAGVASIVLGVRQQLEKKPERPKFKSRRSPPPGS
jgi:hypothetical protein